MSIPSRTTPSTSLLVLETDAAFPSQATGYRGSADTAIIIQQSGEATPGLMQRIRERAAELAQSGAPLATVVLIAALGAKAPSYDRHCIAQTLVQQLSGDDGKLVLVADHVEAELQETLMSLAGTLIEEDHVKQTVALEFNAAGGSR